MVVSCYLSPTAGLLCTETNCMLGFSKRPLRSASSVRAQVPLVSNLFYISHGWRWKCLVHPIPWSEPQPSLRMDKCLFSKEKVIWDRKLSLQGHSRITFLTVARKYLTKAHWHLFSMNLRLQCLLAGKGGSWFPVRKQRDTHLLLAFVFVCLLALRGCLFVPFVLLGPHPREWYCL